MSKVCKLLITFEIAICIIMLCSCNLNEKIKPKVSHNNVGVSSKAIQSATPTTTSLSDNSGMTEVLIEKTQDVYINSIISNADKELAISLPDGWYAKQLRYENYRSWYDIYFEDRLVGGFHVYDRTENVTPIPNHIANKTKTFEGQMKLGQGIIYTLERDDGSSETAKSKFIIYVLIPTTIDNITYYYNLYVDVPKKEDINNYIQTIKSILK